MNGGGGVPNPVVSTGRRRNAREWFLPSSRFSQQRIARLIADAVGMDCPIVMYVRVVERSCGSVFLRNAVILPNTAVRRLPDDIPLLCAALRAFFSYLSLCFGL